MRRHNRGRPCFKRNWKKRIQLQKSSDHPIETSIPTSLCTQKLYVQLKMKTVGQDGIDRPETHAVLQENLTTRSEFAPGPLSIHYGCDFGVFVCLFVCFFGFFFFWCGTPYSTTVEYFWLFNSWDSSYIGLSCLAYHNRRAFTLSYYVSFCSVWLWSPGGLLFPEDQMGVEWG